MHVELFSGKVLSIGGSVYSPDGSNLNIVTGNTLPSGVTTVPYSITLTATGGTAPYTWAVTVGSAPTGMSLSSGGVLNGTPVTSGQPTFGITVTDSASNHETENFTITIAPGTALTVLASLGTFTNVSGTTILPRGFNLQGLEASCAQGNQPWYGSTPLYAQWATAGWYPTCVRIPLNAASFLALNCYQINSTGTGWISTSPTNADPFGNYVAAVDAAIAAVQALGCMVILDLHWSAPILTFGGVTGYVMPLGQPAFLNSDTDLNFWNAIVGRYGNQATPQAGIDNTGIIFELFNEPFLDQIGYSGPTLFGLMHNGGAVTTFSNNNNTTPNVTQTWTALGYNTVVNAIRSAGATNILLINQAAYAHSVQNYAPMPADVVSPPQMGIGFHAYPANAYPYTGGNHFPLTYPESNSGLSGWDGYIQFARAANIPIMVTESGGSYGSTATSLEPFATFVTGWCQTNNAGYIGWTWWPQASTGASGSAVLDTNTAGNPTQGLGVVVQNFLYSYQTLRITNSSPLPTATVGLSYTYTMTAAGGTAPYSGWTSVGTGGNVLPAGLSLSSTTGVISGTPTTPATPTLSIQVQDSASHTYTTTFSLTVNAASSNKLLYANGVSDSTFPIATDLSFTATINRTYSGANVYPGNTNSLQVVTNASNGFGGGWQPGSLWTTIPPNGFDDHTYTYLILDINTASPGNMSFGSHYSRSTGNDIGTSTSLTQGSTLWGITANTWTHLVVPLSSVGMLGSFNFYKFSIGCNINSTYYIDNMYWVPGNLTWAFQGTGAPVTTWSDASSNLGTGSVSYSYLINSVPNPTTGLNANIYAINSPAAAASLGTASCAGTALTYTALTSGNINIGDSACYNPSSPPAVIQSGTYPNFTLATSLGTISSRQWASAPVQNLVTSISMISTVINSTLKMTTSAPITAASYVYFTFGVIPTRSGYGYQVQLFDNTGAATGSAVTMSSTYRQHDYGVNTANWTVYNVPLTAFGAIASLIGGFSIKETSSNTANTTYFSAIGFFS